MISLPPSQQASAEAAFVSAYCPIAGRLWRSEGVPDGAGGESTQDVETGAIQFGINQPTTTTIEDGERTRTIHSATLKVGFSADVRELDVIENVATGERWEVQGIVAGQFIYRLDCLLKREA